MAHTTSADLAASSSMRTCSSTPSTPPSWTRRRRRRDRRRRRRPARSEALRPRALDPSAASVVCTSPAEPIEEAPHAHRLDLHRAAIAISLNAQQFTTTGRYFAYHHEPVLSSIQPPVGPAAGGSLLALRGLPRRRRRERVRAALDVAARGRARALHVPLPLLGRGCRRARLQCQRHDRTGELGRAERAHCLPRASGEHRRAG